MGNNQSTDIARRTVGKGGVCKRTSQTCNLTLPFSSEKSKECNHQKIDFKALRSQTSIKVRETESFCSPPEEPLRKIKRTLNCVIPPFTHACGCLVFSVYLSFFFCPLSASALLSASFVLRFKQPIYLN